jgi:hypothetical protein
MRHSAASSECAVSNCLGDFAHNNFHATPRRGFYYTLVASLCQESVSQKSKNGAGFQLMRLILTTMTLWKGASLTPFVYAG